MPKIIRSTRIRENSITFTEIQAIEKHILLYCDTEKMFPLFRFGKHRCIFTFRFAGCISATFRTHSFDWFLAVDCAKSTNAMKEGRYVAWKEGTKFSALAEFESTKSDTMQLVCNLWILFRHLATCVKWTEWPPYPAVRTQMCCLS